MNPQHPINFVESVLAADKRITEVRLSVYRYHAQSLFDDREPVRSVRVERLREAYDNMAGLLKSGEDIAFHSAVKVQSQDEDRHFGLLDFLARSSEVKVVERTCEELVQEYAPPKAAMVHSGRSYHLYLAKLFNHDEWVAFMGRVLLLNLPDRPMVVDPRWIGHRLMAGYGALRWSDKVRKPEPEIVRQW